MTSLLKLALLLACLFLLTAQVRQIPAQTQYRQAQAHLTRSFSQLGHDVAQLSRVWESQSR